MVYYHKEFIEMRFHYLCVDLLCDAIVIYFVLKMFKFPGPIHIDGSEMPP